MAVGLLKWRVKTSVGKAVVGGFNDTGFDNYFAGMTAIASGIAKEG
jgi:hypothetical protein